MSDNSELLENIQRLRGDFSAGSKLLKILTTDSRLINFTMNNPQLRAHQAIEEQKSRTGMVRKLILKARRQGFSTYCIARNFHGTMFNYGVRAYCLTHHMDTTDELYKMAKRFIEYMPAELGLVTDNNSAKGFEFAGLQSGMNVGTAGGKTVGHGFGITRFHGSELSRWPNAVDHFDGIMQAVSMIDGTEILLESVGGERGNLWHSLWCEAMAGKSKFEPIFVPWFESEQYALNDLSEYSPDSEDLEYQRIYRLTDGQMAWRSAKMREFPVDSEIRFAAMYPSTPEDAFIRLEGGFIESVDVIAARQAAYVPMGPLVFGVDVGGGKDRTTLIRRKGLTSYGMDKTMEKDPMAIVSWIGRRIEQDKPAAVFIDGTGASVGAGVVARLKELGFDVVGVQFGGRADEPVKYINKRVEMWANMRDWLTNGAEIPNSDELENDLLAPNKIADDSSGRLRLESKDDMRARNVPSPDWGDALALTFAYPVYEDVEKIIAPKTKDELIHQKMAKAARRPASLGVSM